PVALGRRHGDAPHAGGQAAAGGAAATAALLLQRRRQGAVDAVVHSALAVEAGEPGVDVCDEADLIVHGDHLADDRRTAAAGAEHEGEALVGHGGQGTKKAPAPVPWEALTLAPRGRRRCPRNRAAPRTPRPLLPQRATPLASAAASCPRRRPRGRPQPEPARLRRRHVAPAPRWCG